MGNILFDEQQHQCRAEEPCREPIGAQIDEDGARRVRETWSKKKVNRVVCRQQQQGTAHNGARAAVLFIDVEVGQPSDNESDTEEQHQRERHTQGVTVFDRQHNRVFRNRL